MASRQLWEIVMDKIPDAVIEAMADKIDWHNDYSPCQRDNELCGIRAALKAAEAAGWVMVPREPTEAMIEKTYDASDGASVEACQSFYRAMIAAAPKVSE